MVKKKTSFQTITPDPALPVDALVITDGLTLRLGKPASLAGFLGTSPPRHRSTTPRAIPTLKAWKWSRTY